MQIIDHDQLDVVLRAQAARLGAQLENGQARAVVDEDLRLSQLRGRSGELGEIALGEEGAVADFL